MRVFFTPESITQSNKDRFMRTSVRARRGGKKSFEKTAKRREKVQCEFSSLQNQCPVNEDCFMRTSVRARPGGKKSFEETAKRREKVVNYEITNKQTRSRTKKTRISQQRLCVGCER
ncbi:hypothetical protein CDAR_183441 [Caerostris darwini]|uniref:Uncharacterized protein n=1 Tax=Caerostris darwini TaxID=1538125 RepID=A0AAV4RP73_9ARAC|nr:hypothetical protein CDAR_183441 [Caerostris darwini]